MIKRGDIVGIEGIQKKRAAKTVENIQNGFYEATVVDLLAASGKFGRGLGKRRLTPILTKFPNIIHEDIPVIFQVYYFSEKIIKLNDIIYYKVFRDTSIVNNLTKKRINGLLDSFRIVLAFLREKELNINELMPYYLIGFVGIVGSLIELNLKFYLNDFSFPQVL